MIQSIFNNWINVKIAWGLVIGLSKISSCFSYVMINSFFFNRVQKGDVKSAGM